MLRPSLELLPNELTQSPCSRFLALPLVQSPRQGGGHEYASLVTRDTLSQQFVVLRMRVPDVSPHGQFNGVRLKLLRRGRPPNATRIFLARMSGNLPLLVNRTSRKQFSDA